MLERIFKKNVCVCVCVCVCVYIYTYIYIYISEYCFTAEINTTLYINNSSTTAAIKPRNIYVHSKHFFVTRHVQQRSDGLPTMAVAILEGLTCT